MLTATQEATLVGELRGADRPVHISTISRARRHDPKHPAYRKPDGSFTDPRSDHALGPSGDARRAPEDAVRAYWAARGVRTATPQPPEGLTRTQWASLQALATDGTPPSRTTRTRLTARGWLDGEGNLTDRALAVLPTAAHE